MSRKICSAILQKCRVMDQQILDALNGVYENAADRTSRGGNIAVMGSERMRKDHTDGQPGSGDLL